MTNYSPNSFSYSNKTYTLNISLYSVSDDAPPAASFTANDIEMFRYSQSLNELIISGNIIYVDKYAKVDKFLSESICYCNVSFEEHLHPKDDSSGIGTPDPGRSFYHTFIVTNISPIERVAHQVKYSIDIVSSFWVNCAANIRYTNYDRSKESIFSIFKNCLTMAGLRTDDKSFSQSDTDVKMNYISKTSDNLFSVTDFLMNKLYYFDDAEQSMKFFVNDMFDFKYKLIDLKNSATTLGSFSTILSMFKTNGENLIQQEPTNLGSFIDPVDKTKVYSNIFDKTIYGYSYKTNEFIRTNFDARRNLNFLNNKIDNSNYRFRFERLPIQPNLDFQQVCSYWNNNFDFYGNAVSLFRENNALVINVTGDIIRQAGSLTTIMLDRTMSNMTNDSTKALKEEKLKYRNYEGIWFNFKVENEIKPMVSFRQKVVLFRNFNPFAQKPQTVPKK